LVAGRKLPTAADIARFGYEATMSGRAVAVPGLTNKLTAELHRVFPRSLVRKMVQRVQEPRAS